MVDPGALELAPGLAGLDFPPRVAAITPPIAAPPITASSATFFVRPLPAFGGPTLIWRMSAVAISPWSDAVTRILKGPAIRFGFNPRPAAWPSGPVVRVMLASSAPKVPPAPRPGRIKFTTAPATGRPSPSSTRMTGSFACRASILFRAPSPSTTTTFKLVCAKLHKPVVKKSAIRIPVRRLRISALYRRPGSDSRTGRSSLLGFAHSTCPLGVRIGSRRTKLKGVNLQTREPDPGTEFAALSSEGQEFAVECSRAVLAALDRQATAAFRGPPPGVGTGGVLFGRKTGSSLRILAFRPVQGARAASPEYGFTEKDETRLEELLRSASSDAALLGLIPLGWYHSHTGEGIGLRGSDLRLYDRFFPEPWQFALALQPVPSAPTRATYIFRQGDGSLAAPDPREEFIIVWPQPGHTSYSGRRLAFVLGSVALGGLLVAPLLLTRKNVSVPESRGISLRVSDEAGQLHIEWNQQAQPVIEADRAQLNIVDGSNPVRIDLDRVQLQTGSVYYSPSSAHAAIRMVLERPGAAPLEESTNFTGAPARQELAWSPPPPPPEVPAAPTPERERFIREPPAPRPFHPPVSVQPSPPVHSRSVVDMPGVVVRPSANLGVLPSGMEPRPIIPAPLPPAAPALLLPHIPAAGQIIWTGRLERRGVVEIEGQQASSGHLSGSLPGAPAVITVLPGELTPTGLRLYTTNPRPGNRSESAGPQNGWNATEYVWDPARAAEITVLEPPATQNGWTHLVLRSENRSYSVIVVKWKAKP